MEFHKRILTLFFSQSTICSSHANVCVGLKLIFTAFITIYPFAISYKLCPLYTVVLWLKT